jgi:beta-lactam-binding protein with PASTA domain
MIKSITHRPLWLNILVGVLLVIIIFAIFLASLKWLTHHDQSSTVPLVVGKKYADAEKQLDKLGFDVEIEDSVYVDTLPPMSVIRQIPDADEVVKENRTVYLVINRSVPPIVEMPNLVGYSFRNAEMVLKNMDLRIGDTTFKPDFAKNSVLEQVYKGSIITPGTQIRKGSAISLVLGDGVGNREFAVPIIVGMTYGQAKALLESNGLVIGAVVAPGVIDTANAYINKQIPERYDDDRHIQHIRPGQTIDLWLQFEKPTTDSTEIHLPE